MSSNSTQEPNLLSHCPKNMHIRRIIPTTITVFFLCTGLLACDRIAQNTLLSLDLSRELRKQYLVYIGKSLEKPKTDRVHHNLLADRLILLALLSADHQRSLQAGEASPFYRLPTCKVTSGPPNKLAASQLAGRYYSHQSVKKSKQCQTRLWLPLPRRGYLECWSAGRTTNRWLWLRVRRQGMLGLTSQVPHVLLNVVFLMRLWPLVHDGSALFFFFLVSMKHIQNNFSNMTSHWYLWTCQMREIVFNHDRWIRLLMA